MNDREQLWVQWFLGVFGIAGLGLGLALMGLSIERNVGWLTYALGTLAFGIVPWLAVGCRPPLLSGGIMGIAMAIGGLGILIIFASIYGVGFPPLALVTALFLAFLGGSLGEPNLGTR